MQFIIIVFSLFKRLEIYFYDEGKERKPAAKMMSYIIFICS